MSYPIRRELKKQLAHKQSRDDCSCSHRQINLARKLQPHNIHEEDFNPFKKTIEKKGRQGRKVEKGKNQNVQKMAKNKDQILKKGGSEKIGHHHHHNHHNHHHNSGSHGSGGGGSGGGHHSHGDSHHSHGSSHHSHESHHSHHSNEHSHSESYESCESGSYEHGHGDKHHYKESMAEDVYVFMVDLVKSGIMLMLGAYCGKSQFLEHGK